MTELTIELDDARSLMYRELEEELDEEKLKTTIDRVVQKKITSLYDNKDELKERED